MEKKADIPKFLYEQGGNLPSRLVALGVSLEDLEEHE